MLQKRYFPQLQKKTGNKKIDKNVFLKCVKNNHVLEDYLEVESLNLYNAKKTLKLSSIALWFT